MIEAIEHRLIELIQDVPRENKSVSRGEETLEIIGLQLELIHFQKALLGLARLRHTDLDSAFRRITETVATTLVTDRVGIWLFSADRSEIVCFDLYGAKTDTHDRGIRLRIGDTPRYLQALETTRTISAEDAAVDPRTSELAEAYLEPNGIKSVMNVPIRLQGQIVGIVCHEQTSGPRSWSLPEQEFAGSIADLVSLTLEIAERQKAEGAMREAQARFHLIVNNSPIILFTTDAQGIFTLADGKGLEGLGLKPDELVGRSIFEIYKEDPSLLRNVRKTLEGATFEDRVEIRGGPGKGRVLQIHYAPIRDGSGTISGLTGVATDVTERKLAEDRLHYLAYHDSLTGLPNRHLFDDRLTVALAHARRSGDIVALLLLDLDNFKTINDTFGHDTGDKVLQAVARRMKSHLREGDSVARLGGDEFILLLPHVRRLEDVEAIADRLFDVLKPPIKTGQKSLNITTSMGISLFPRHGLEPKTLLKNADVALYLAKHEGRNNFRFCPDLQESAMS